MLISYWLYVIVSQKSCLYFIYMLYHEVVEDVEASPLEPVYVIFALLRVETQFLFN